MIDEHKWRTSIVTDPDIQGVPSKLHVIYDKEIRLSCLQDYSPRSVAYSPAEREQPPVMHYVIYAFRSRDVQLYAGR